MSLVYVVTVGSYSDYSIVGVFSTAENARKYMATFKRGQYDGYNDLEEYDLDQAISNIDSGKAFYEVTMTKSGNVLNIERAKQEGEYPFKWRDKEWINGKLVPLDDHRGVFRMWAKNEETAIKIANDRRIAELAKPDKTQEPNT